MTTDVGRLRSVVFSDGCAMDFETAPNKADGWPYEGISGTVFRCPHGKLYEVDSALEEGAQIAGIDADLAEIEKLNDHRIP